MIRRPVFALIIWALCGGAVAAQELQESGPNTGRTRALSGDTVIFRGHVVRLEGLKCPAANTEKGIDAKALANTFLRNPYVECDVWSRDNENWQGRCAVNGFRVAGGRDMAQGMIASGLCAEN